MIIRKAKIKDLNNLLKMVGGLLDSHLKFDRFYFSYPRNYKRNAIKSLRSHINGKNSCVFIAEIDDKYAGYIIGNISLRKDRLFNARKIGSIFELFVKEKYRGQGIAKALINELFNWFKKKEVEVAEVQVSIDNEIANKAYDSFGFKTIICKKYKRLR